MSVKKPVSVELQQADKVGEAADRPYLSLYRLRLRTHYNDGSCSASYPYDAVLRKWLDAVVVILTAEMDGEVQILLRTCLRPPLLLRHMAYIPTEDAAPSALVRELPAGLLEPGDEGPEGILHRARAETLEEAGYDLPLTAFSLLNGAPWVTPGVLPERIWYVRAHVANPADVQEPPGDGSLLEAHAQTQWIPLGAALEMCDRGEIDDMKTELGIRRLARLQGL
ncbi:MAG: NUDIX hydrolase [Myxococcales bacterium]|jgi:ADP-ribose pyrophosphatase|nr:NUDIX hydrolase [Myxococcales bacterium]